MVMGTSGHDITGLLRAHDSGDERAMDHLHEVLYEPLRQIARGQLRKIPSPNQTLDTHGLIHEAYLKLVDQTRSEYRDREHFFAAAAQVMRHVLIDLARRRSAEKRGGEAVRIDFEKVELGVEEQAPMLLEVNRALEQLEQRNPRLVRVVECRFFGGYSEEETASVLKVSRSTAQRDWIKAKGFLRRSLGA